MEASLDSPEELPERRRLDRPLRVLIADDERDTADSLAEVLRDEGRVVHVVYSGADVLPRVSLFRPDAIILDINLPKVSGFALAQATRFGLQNVRRPVIIAITGVWTEAPDRIVGKQVGFDHYLVKPANPNELIGLLDAHQGRHR